MANAQLEKVVRYVRMVAQPHDAPLTDAHLLECFVTRREEAAFAALVRRHGPMVLGVCRRVLDHSHDADDAFQATFLVLVRKAASVTPRESVGNWLYGVAYRTALKARTLAAKRRHREQHIPARTAPSPADDLICRELRAVLDRELSRLPDKYRAPLVLCDLEGKTRKEVARQLCLNEGTLSSRLATARKLLARPLARRGLLLSSAVPGAIFSPHAASAAVPALLLQSTIDAASIMAANPATAAALLPPKVAALTQGVLTSMFVNKLQTAAVVVLTFAVLGLGAGMYLNQANADKPAAKPADADAKDKPEKGPSVHGVVKAYDAGKNTLTVTVQVHPEKKQTEDKTYEIAKDAKVTLDEALIKGAKPIEGKLADLTEGTLVNLELTPGGKTIAQIVARGPHLQGSIKSCDANARSMTVTHKQKDGLKEETLTLVKDAKVLLNDGLSKEVKDKEGKLDDLTEGTPVLVFLSVDRKRALEMRPQGETVHGTLKGYDSGNATLTVTVKEDGSLVDKSYPVAKDAHLTDLSEGSPVAARLSVFDKKTVVEAHGLK
jgi:RNA polymerase sigma factor (sigma-70 family)